MKRYLKRRFAGLRAGLIALLSLGFGVSQGISADNLPDEVLPVATADEEPAPLEEPPVARETSRLVRTPVAAKEKIVPLDEVPIAEETPEQAPADGNVEIIQERYANGAVKTERGVRQDANGNYVLNGDWRSFDQNGVLIAEGQYENNHRHGVWRRFFRGDEAELFKTSPYSEFKGPFVSQTVFQRGKLQGAWVINDSKQRKISEIHFVNDQRHGSVRWWHATGRLAQELYFENGQIHGEGRLWDVNGTLIRKENYVQGRRVGSNTEHYDGGQKKQQTEFLAPPLVAKSSDDWWNAKLCLFTETGKEERHGHFAAWHVNGMKQRQGEYEHGLAVGKMTWWYANGQKSVEGTYAQGKPTGTWNWWHENGQKSIAGEFVDGSPEGQWQWWKPDGRLSQKVDLTKTKDVARAQPKTIGIPDVEGWAPRSSNK